MFFRSFYPLWILDLDLGQFIIALLLFLKRVPVATCGIDLGQFAVVAFISPGFEFFVPALCCFDLGHVDCLVVLKSEGCGRTDQKDCC